MSRPPVRESKVEKDSMTFAESRGWWTCKFVSPGKRGVPDRLLIRKGRVVFVEFKAPGKLATDQQKLRHTEIRDLDIEVFVIDNVDEARRILL